jgi:predicted dehydrogenase
MMGAATAASAWRIVGANDRIRLGVVGTGNRGKYLMRRAIAAGNIEWVALCDAYDARRDEAEALCGKRLDKYADYRRLVERTDIDGVIIATWDHMHCTITAESCYSGKDVFVEKPMTLHPMEGHEIIKAARESKRIVQVGTQQRSMPHFREAKERFIDSGRIGRVTMVRTIWNANRAYRNQRPPDGMEKKPKGLDWELCQGDLPKVPWNPKRYFNHYVYWDYSTNAQVGGLFVHMVDVVHWYLNLHAPLACVAIGGIYLTDEGRDTADNFNAILQYPGKINVTFEANVTDMIRKSAADIVFMGEKGRLNIFRYGYRFLPTDADEEDGEITAGTTPDLHVSNWLDCIRGRIKANVDEVEGHYSAMACHVANIAYKEDRRVTWMKEWDV